MRKTIIILLVSTFLFFIVGCDENYTDCIYKVTLIPKEISNNSVGNDWEIKYLYENGYIESGKKWIIPIDSVEIKTIKVVIKEKDEFSDFGYDFLDVKLVDDFITYKIIEIEENNGCFKGNKAVWKVTCIVELVEKIS